MEMCSFLAVALFQLSACHRSSGLAHWLVQSPAFVVWVIKVYKNQKDILDLNQQESLKALWQACRFALILAIHAQYFSEILSFQKNLKIYEKISLSL